MNNTTLGPDGAITDQPAFPVLPGYAVELRDTEILLRGPFDDNLHARIKRLGGAWDGQTGQNRKLWVIPVNKSDTLRRVLANWSKAKGGEGQLQAAAAKREAERLTQARNDAVRWLGYVEDQAGRGCLYSRGLDRLAELNIAQWPELAARLAQATALAKEKKGAADAAMKARRDQVNAERDQRARERRETRDATGQARRATRVLLDSHTNLPLNVPVRLNQRPVVFTGFGRWFPIPEDAPSLYGSHLLGCEGEDGRYGYYRAATDDEVAELERHEAAEAEKREAAKARAAAIGAIRAELRERGERPAEAQSPEGVRVLDSQSLYGGGDWFVIGSDWIWYVLNNGADGDDWSLNNVITGGAGAIGWRVPYSADLADQLQRLNEANT